MAGRYKKKEEERKSEYVKFRCTPAQKEQILKNCGEENLSSFLLKTALRRKNNYVHLSQEVIMLKTQLRVLTHELKQMTRQIDWKGNPRVKSKEIEVLKGITELVRKTFDELKKNTDQQGEKSSDKQQ